VCHSPKDVAWVLHWGSGKNLGRAKGEGTWWGTTRNSNEAVDERWKRNFWDMETFDGDGMGRCLPLEAPVSIITLLAMVFFVFLQSTPHSAEVDVDL
jgi:hypothetical protein